MAGFNVSREVAVLPVATQVESRYVMYAMAAPASQEWLADRAKGVAYTGVNIEDLRLLPLPVPSRDEQRELVARVDRLLAVADVIATRLSAAQAHADRLQQSILARAFAGEFESTHAAGASIRT